jgi:hypothetical protein
MAVNWREAERLAWKPKEGRELSRDEARRILRKLQDDAEGFHAQLQLVRALLDVDQAEDCRCGRILSSMPEGGGNG